MDKKEGMRNCCEHCHYAIKKYLSIYNRFFYQGTYACCINSENSIVEKPLEEKVNCEHFTPDRIPAPRNDTEQRIAFVSRQVEELSDLLGEVLEKLGITKDDVIAQEPTEDVKHGE